MSEFNWTREEIERTLRERNSDLSTDEFLEIIEVARAMKEPADYGPPRSFRGTVRPCVHHDGTPHWHLEAVASLPGGIVAHYHDPEPYSSERVAKAILMKFAERCGFAGIEIVPHDAFVHSTEPEVMAIEEEDARE